MLRRVVSTAAAASGGLFLRGSRRIRVTPEFAFLSDTSGGDNNRARPGVCSLSSSVPAPGSRRKSELEWAKELSAEEYNVLRQAGTERPGSGIYNKAFPEQGHFACRACGSPLYDARSKFDSGCGWPAFDSIYDGAVYTKEDKSLAFMAPRVEILCAACDSHLGHVFEGEQFTPTNERHCVNSISIEYKLDAPSAGTPPIVKAR